MRRGNLLSAIGGLMVGLVAAVHLTLRAQDEASPKAGAPQASASRPESSGRPSPAPTVQDALLRPFRFSYKEPVTLTELASRLGRELGAPVVLDVAALKRQDLEASESVSLALDVVRLKTGLKLLLDQVGLTYRVVPEDNLLVLTDKEGTEEPIERLAEEVRELHRDVHELQDAVDEIRDLLDPAEGDGPRVRKPTIIEELPEHAEGEPEGKESAPSAKIAPRSSPDLEPAPVPLARPRTRL